ncbi:cysteine proteinase [Crucibulum laeve]|uniref:Cysteine proteinase n=1 Tax=Crucibulum laeve TaxID=68775 RepID=A0A5C3M9H9_9AGAR|nr:cysteine proteinase [Crucibulum laeve]
MTFDSSIELDDETEFLQRAIFKAHATLKAPKPPKPFSPTLEQLTKSLRVKDEELELRLRPPRPTLPSSLPPEDEVKVKSLLNKQGVVSKFAREQVSNQDLSRLRPGQWLNDELINFYGAMILARSEESKENSVKWNKGNKKPLDVHYFSSFFWAKLTGDGYEKGRLAKWTKKIDIFSKDVILIPVNHGNAHWTAAAINFRKKRLESYDSMGMAKEKVFKVLHLYLDEEHRNKKKKPFDFTGWENWAPDDTPQQENGYDCGVFTCQFLEALSRGEEDFIFTQKDMPYLRRRMIWEIGNSKLRDDY